MITTRPTSSRTTIETVLVLLLFLGLMYALFDVLKFFFGVLTFALIFAVSFYHLFERCCKWFGKRRKLVAVIYSMLLISIVVLPFVFVLSALGHHVRDAWRWLAGARVEGIPPLPDWLTGLPYVGEEINNFWHEVQEKPRETVMLYSPQLRMALQRALTGGAAMLGSTFEIIAGIIISAILLVSSEKILKPVHTTLGHILGHQNGESLVDTTAQAVKGVAIGVMGTAFIAALFSWIGLAIAGVHFAAGLVALIFFLVLIQVGPLVVWIPLVVWTAAQGHTGMAIFLAIYGVALVVLDTVLKPLLIAKSGKLPFLVLFIGVIGGMLAWGFTGMFKGAIILSVFYTVFNSWLERKSDAIEIVH